MAKNEVVVGKIFSFDSSHQLVGHCGKCANVHGHTYKLEVMLKGEPHQTNIRSYYSEEDYRESLSNEGFVIDFYRLKQVVNRLIVDRLDHAFIAKGDEPILPVLLATNAKVVQLGFRSTVENMARYIVWRLMREDLPIYCVRLWETPTGWAEVYVEDIDLEEGPNYANTGGCDLD